MENRNCFNCGSISHISLRCPEAQKYTRCTTCEKVCFSENSHASFCTQKRFRSTHIDSDMIQEIEEILVIQMKPIDGLFVVSSGGDKPINDAPMWFANANMQIKSNGENVVFSAIKPSKCRTVVILDNDGDRRIKIVVSNEVMVLNDHYKIFKDGSVSYNRFEEQNIWGHADCKLKFATQHYLIHAKITWQLMGLFIDIFPDGVVLQDPCRDYLNKRMKDLMAYDLEGNLFNH